MQNPETPSPAREADIAAVRELAEARRLLQAEIEKRIVGQRDVVERTISRSSSALG